jgi:hypothetical protein
MTKIDESPGKRRGGSMWGLILIVVILIGVTWLTAPRHTTTGDTGTALASVGVVEPGPKPSTSLVHPGSMTQGQAGTDSRDNGTPQGGRAAPASDSAGGGAGQGHGSTGTGPG